MTPIPRGVSARKFMKALKNDGFTEYHVRGSHHVFIHEDGREVVVAAHRMSDTFPTGTLKHMIAQAQWTEEDLRRLELL